VRVQDRVDEQIAGRDGCAYASPPAPRDSALALVGLLLGADPPSLNGGGAWTRAVPGGRRTITLAAMASIEASHGSGYASATVAVIGG
jgi:hypothetical protein